LGGCPAVAVAAHAVTITILRKRYEIAVLRALGMTRVQARMIMRQGEHCAALQHGLSMSFNL
jgi:hypothetical protein